jgi:hypothetical protein
MKERLYTLTGIRSPEEFHYFENMADLMESEEEITEEELYAFLEELDKAGFADLLSQYFDHIQEWIPDGETDVYTLVENIHHVMAGYLQELEREGLEATDSGEVLSILVGEIIRFRRWFLFDDNVVCTNERTADSYAGPVIDALGHARAERLGEDPYHFDFSRALHYELDRLTIIV